MSNLNISGQTTEDEDTVYYITAHSPSLDIGMEILPSSMDQTLELDSSVEWILTTTIWDTTYTKTYAAGELEGINITLRDLT